MSIPFKWALLEWSTPTLRGFILTFKTGHGFADLLENRKKSPELEQTFQKFFAAKWAVLAPIFFDDKKVHEHTFQMSPFGMIYSNFKGVYFEIQNGSWIRRLLGKSKNRPNQHTFQKLIAAKWAVLAPIFFNDKKVHEYIFQMSPFGMIYSNFKGVYFEIQNGSWIRRLLGKSKIFRINTHLKN